QAEPLEREEALYALIRNCARSGESWIAVDEIGHIVGFLLAEPNQARRHYAEHEIIELHYGGVVKTHRRRGIFSTLVERLLERMVPVMATVSPANRSGAAELLHQLGFHLVASPGREQRLRWEPGTEGAYWRRNFWTACAIPLPTGRSCPASPATAPRASSSSSSARGVAANPPCCAWSPDSKP